MDDIAAVSYDKRHGRIARGEKAALFSNYLPEKGPLAGDDAIEREGEMPHWSLSLLVDAWDHIRYRN